MITLDYHMYRMKLGAGDPGTPISFARNLTVGELRRATLCRRRAADGHRGAELVLLYICCNIFIPTRQRSTLYTVEYIRAHTPHRAPHRPLTTHIPRRGTRAVSHSTHVSRTQLTMLHMRLCPHHIPSRSYTRQGMIHCPEGL